MKTMKLGKTGMDVSRIGLGTWSIGGGSAWGWRPRSSDSGRYDQRSSKSWC